MRKVCLLVVALALAALPALGQQEQGDSELQAQGTLLIGTSGDTDDFGAVFGNYGYFLTDRTELGGTIAAFIDSEGDFIGAGGPFWRYNFSTGRTVPYVGASALTTFGDFAEGDVLLTGEVGVRWFLQRNTAFTLAGTTNYDVDASEFSDFIQVLFGFSYIWGK